MTFCTACNRETRPFRELDPARGMVRKCGFSDCKSGLQPEVPPVAVAPALAAVAPSPVPVVAAHVQLPVTVIPASAPIGEPRSLDMLRAEMQKRLDYVRARLAELHAFQREEQRLSLALETLDVDADTSPTKIN